jgi:hypothetical protein
MSGHHDDRAEPCPNVWDPERKVMTDSWKEHFFEAEIKSLERIHELQNIRIS